MSLQDKLELLKLRHDAGIKYPLKQTYKYLAKDIRLYPKQEEPIQLLRNNGGWMLSRELIKKLAVESRDFKYIVDDLIQHKRIRESSIVYKNKNEIIYSFVPELKDEPEKPPAEQKS